MEQGDEEGRHDARLIENAHNFNGCNAYGVLGSHNAFVDPASYYATATHELGHWTGAPTCLNRQFGKFGESRVCTRGNSSRPASLYLCAVTGIPFVPEQIAGYIKDWIAVLKNDKNEFFKASDAAGISDYLLGRKGMERRTLAHRSSSTAHESRVLRLSE